MVKRASESKKSKAYKKAKLSNEHKIAANYITTKSNEIINEINELDNEELKSIIQIYDLFLPFISKEETFNEHESSIRLLNLQIFKIFEKLFELNKFNKNSDLITIYEMFKLNLLFFLETIPYDCSLLIDNLKIYMKLLKFESISFNNNESFFPNKTFNDLVISIYKSTNGEILNDGTNSSIIVHEFINNYFLKYKDLQFYFFYEIKIDQFKNLNLNIELVFSKFLTVAKNSIIVLDEDFNKTFIKNLPEVFKKNLEFKLSFENKWLYFLGNELSTNQYKTILLILHKRIIPFFNKPSKLMDFLTDSYNIGGINSILALNGLFELMKRYNLDYPNFYIKLYSLFNEDLLHVKYRSRFFRLSDIFLSSTHLPSSIIASFIKRLARLSVTASPSAIVTIIPFIYNLLKRHPTCMVLLQSDTADEYSDPFDALEKDPLKTNALGSSLWEVETLQSHYHPNVATLAKIFSQPFKKQSYNMEDFLDWSYSSLLESENTRKMKDEVALEYENFESLLGDYIKKWNW